MRSNHNWAVNEWNTGVGKPKRRIAIRQTNPCEYFGVRCWRCCNQKHYEKNNLFTAHTPFNEFL